MNKDRTTIAIENIQKLTDDYQNFLLCKQIFDSQISVIKQLNVSENHIYVYFIKSSFFQYAVSTIGRMIDNRSDSMSIVRLLLFIKNNSIYFDKSFYTAKIPYEDQIFDGIEIKSNLKKILIEEYNEIFGKNIESRIDSDLDFIKNDITIKKMESIRNNVVAHMTNQQYSYSITQSEIDYVIDKIEELLLRYRLLLLQIGPIEKGDLNVVIPYRWQDLLKDISAKL